jgi:cell division septum initiation protein DivIVA
LTDKEFRRLNRMELIEMIRLLRESEARLKSENDDLRAQLADRRTRLDNAGNIAEALFSISGIAEAAQAAAEEMRKHCPTVFVTGPVKREQ